ncbi:MAG: hypothetical protein ACI395_01775 [Candidatus Cryptobacteroides sp.]
MMTLSALILVKRPLMQIPSPGAVWPAMVRSPFLISRGELRVIVPATSKTIVLAPFWETAHLREPSVLRSSSVVT